MDDLLKKLITNAGHDPSKHSNDAALVLRPEEEGGNIEFKDHDPNFDHANRFANGLAAVLANIELVERGEDGAIVSWNVESLRELMIEIDNLTDRIDQVLQDRLQLVVEGEALRKLEVSWRSLNDMTQQVNESGSNEIIVDFIDVTKETLGEDFEDHSAYILTSSLFKKVYIDEYDRYGGRPFGAMIGLYEFNSSEDDIAWLRTMSNVASNAHCPFIATVEPQFFGVETWDDLELKEDVEELLNLPQFGPWARFRETHGAAYIGLTLPRFLLRAPYKPRGSKSERIKFTERIGGSDDYLWGSAAVLFARNMIRSFATSGWCQHIAGPLGGGLIEGLPVHMVEHHGQEELQPPVEIEIPDYRELQFANAGFIPLVYCKGSSDATFFSARSVKKAIEFEEDLATKNADLVCNLAYTLSITRIAHYVKRMVRDYIGSTADAPYIQAMLERWLVNYVTTAVNPDDLTLRYFPFKAMSVAVEPKPGPFGWYSCVVSVLPHIQFQGMDVELRLEAALGG